MKKLFFKFLILFSLACVFWGKYMWDKIQENSTGFLFKILAVSFLLVSFYFLGYLILKLIEKKENKSETDDSNSDIEMNE